MDEKTRAGIDKVIKNFNTILASLGVEEIVLNVGDEFDESVAEAVLNFPCGEGEKPNAEIFVFIIVYIAKCFR